MDQALEPICPEPTSVTLLWCDHCGSAARREAYEQNEISIAGTMTTMKCPSCERYQTQHAQTTYDWFYYPLILMNKYYQIGMPLAYVGMILVLYGLWSIIAWML